MDGAELSDHRDVRMLGKLKIHSEVITVRECPRCGSRWPADWDYCQSCAVWLVGNEREERSTTIVPSAGARITPQLDVGETLIAAEIRHGSTSDALTQLNRARDLLEGAMTAITAHEGHGEWIRDRGIVGHWTDPRSGTEQAARAICATMAEPSEHSTRIHRESSLGVGVVLANQSKCADHPLNRAFRLASLAHPNRAFFSRYAYEQVVERFDFHGVQPVVPRAEHLEPTFELLGPKPERSGTHHVGRDKVPMVGRRELLEELDHCRLEAAGGKSIVVHIVAQPGQGKSRLIREWLSKCNQAKTLDRSIRLACNGVPYGDYPLRSWQRLVEPLRRTRDLNAAAEVPTARKISEKLRARGRPVLVVIDDLHWIDRESRSLIVELISGLDRALTILAYRPSFTTKPSLEPVGFHRRFQLMALTEKEMATFLELLAEEARVKLQTTPMHELVTKAQGSPLYAKEAIAHIAAVGVKGLQSLPSSLVELLIFRTKWAVAALHPKFDRWQREQKLWGSEQCELVDELEQWEEELTSWLDRFDVLEEESAQTVANFLDGLRRVDGELAILNLLVGRQRPHRNRLAQALTRIQRLVEDTKSST
jgi:AAA ATPase domain